MSVDYEILLPADEPRVTGSASRQYQKQLRRGVMIWNSYEKGTYVKRRDEHMLGVIPGSTSNIRSTKPAPVF